MLFLSVFSNQGFALKDVNALVTVYSYLTDSWIVKPIPLSNLFMGNVEIQSVQLYRYLHQLLVPIYDRR